jgi:translation initiation factor 3 subunit B
VFLRWGGGKDDKYFARLGKNVISVYETETFSLLDKKSLKVENVVDFSWSPTDPIISLFVPELGGGNQPARVSINAADISFKMFIQLVSSAKTCAFCVER